MKVRILTPSGHIDSETVRKASRSSWGPMLEAGIEFAEAREYIDGDDVRRIDWNVTARMGTPWVKQYVEERDLSVLCAVDRSASVRVGTPERGRFGAAAELVALLSFAAGVRRYWIVTTVFGLIVALMDLGYLWALGIPLAGVWAVLAFVTNYIPNIGFVIGHEDQGLVFSLIVSRHSRPFRTRVAVPWRPPALLPDPLPRPEAREVARERRREFGTDENDG